LKSADDVINKFYKQQEKENEKAINQEADQVISKFLTEKQNVFTMSPLQR